MNQNSVEAMSAAGLEILGGKHQIYPILPVVKEKFVAMFGLTPKMCQILWMKCSVPKSKPKHLLWMLYFLRQYSKTGVLRTVLKSDPKTIKKWVWRMVDEVQHIYSGCVSSKVQQMILCAFVLKFLTCASPHISFLPASLTQVKWSNRNRGRKNRTCRVTVDGTDFAIREPRPFSKKWYSHKLHGPAIRYEIAVCIQTGDIMWGNGPFAAGLWPDQKIFKTYLAERLAPGEMVEVDGGYGGPLVRQPTDYVSKADKDAKDNARARHETINRYFKQWSILHDKFRHPLKRHKKVCKAVVAITQISIEEGFLQPFQIQY
jgi:hypothetical protein